jgi:hypothetical protein
MPPSRPEHGSGPCEERHGSRVLAVLDLRAVPGLWMIPNMETRSALPLAPGQEGIYAWKGSLTERQVDTIAAKRLVGMKAIVTLLGVRPPLRVRLVFYADDHTEIEQTGHQGVGWAFGTTPVEVYHDTVQLDPYHELTHIIAGAAGSPPAAFNEGFAIYASERLGADALRFLGYGGKVRRCSSLRARKNPGRHPAPGTARSRRHRQPARPLRPRERHPP